ncbi:monofunctional biosynthetic peptidoglycan transglycosylase, partial [Mesorhizobium sp. M0913]
RRRPPARLPGTWPNRTGRKPATPGPGRRRLAAWIDRRAGRAGAYVGCLR